MDFKGYDIIGDVHGHYDLLKHALKEMGYRKSQGTYSHPERQAVFVGDILNKGPKVRKSIRQVRRMIEAGSAQMVLGNHEYMYMAYHLRDGAGKYLLSHNAKNTRRLQNTLSDISDGEQRNELASWLRKQPLFLEVEGCFRVVHACWQEEAVNYVRRQSKKNRLTKAILRGSVIPHSQAQQHLMTLLSGPKLVQKRGKGSYQLQGRRFAPQSIKMKWWLEPSQPLRNLSVKKKISSRTSKAPRKYRKAIQPYPPEALPLFIGHYRLSGSPDLLTPNLCCVDFGSSERDRLVVYRYSGEKNLTASNLVSFSLA